MKQKMVNIILGIGILLSLFFSWYKVIPCEITNDTYIGTIVTTLSIAITLVIGYQIINVIEIRKDLREQRAENERERNHYAQLIKDAEQKSLVLERKIKKQENETSEGLNLLNALIVFNNGQDFVTCADAFAIMHKALQYSIETERTEYEWIFLYLRKFVSVMQVQAFNASVSFQKDGKITINVLGHPYYGKELKTMLDDYCKPIHEVDGIIRSNPNYMKIKMEYERVMMHFENRIQGILKDPITPPSQEEQEFIMTH